MTPWSRSALGTLLGAGLFTSQVLAQAPAKPAAAAPSAPAPPAAAPSAPAPPAAAPAAPVPAPPAASLSDSLTGDAKNEYEAAKILYADGDYAGAALKFHHAYELAGDARLLWNEAAAEKNQRHYARVEALIQQYLVRGGPASDAERADAQALLETVRAFIADATIRVSEPGATVYVDDQPVGVSPLPGPVRVDMGSRRVRVSKPGFKEFARTLEVMGGGQASLEATLESEVHEGRLRVVGGVGTTLRIDGKMVGMGQWEGTLPSGVHTVEVTADHKLPYRSDSVVLQDGQLTTVQVALQNEPVMAPPLAASSSNLSWLWISGGVVLAAGAGVGAYFLFKPGHEGPPAPVEGSLGWVPLGLRL